VGVEATMNRPVEVLRTNTLSAIAVFDWVARGGLAKGGRLIFSSTSESYSFAQDLPCGLTIPSDESVPLVVTDPANPRSAYSASKILGETYLLQLARTTGIAAAVIRYHNVYGPRMGAAHVIPQVFARLASGDNPLVRFGATQTRAFCHVDDAVQATRRLIECEDFATAGIVHVGDDRREISVAELYDAMMTVCGIRVATQDQDAPGGSPARRCPDTSKLTRLTGFSPRVELENGLSTTWDWYRSRLTRSPAAGPTLLPARIPLAVPSLTADDVAAVSACVRAGWVSAAGPDVEGLARDFEERWGLGPGMVCPTSSATTALQLALRVVGVGHGDLVILPDLTFAGTANPVYALGARPVLLDVEATNGGLDPLALESFLAEECLSDSRVTIHRATGARIKAVLPVHLLGHACRIDEIVRIAHDFGLAVVEDAAEALGTMLDGRPAGTIADLGVFSFNGNKIMTGGSGGLIVSRDPELVRRANHLATTARVRHPEDASEWLHDEPGYNFRMTNLVASLVRSQLTRLDEHLSRKRAIARRYHEALAEIPGIDFFTPDEGTTSSQ
ncbi:MAG: DegT/DnrJ/EryC1/StrS family aminotransferase, partial [Planctomycetes bacterium]|nr:DegT/DnrJ/EryC1/StrS family aminotransferase [Planctomycetota bacterium]